MKLKVSYTVDLTDDVLDKWHTTCFNEYRWDNNDDFFVYAETKKELREMVVEYYRSRGYEIEYDFA